MTTGRRGFLLGTAGVLAFPGTASAAGARAVVFTNNIGYEAAGPKRAVIAAERPGTHRFELVEYATGEVVRRGTARRVGAVPDWQANHFPEIPTQYSVVDFSSFTKPGEYVLTVDGYTSRPFVIEPLVLERHTLHHVVRFFKDSRSFGEYDRVDRSLPYEGDPALRVDAHGGWYDAAADWSKHFTQLSRYSFCNTLQLPLTAWVLFAAYDELTRRGDPNFVHLRELLLDEALYGAEYLTRVKMPNASFYGSVRQPQENDISVDPRKRFLRKGPLNFREGCGVAIAALARAAAVVPGAYLEAAESAFAWLQVNNLRLTNDGKENIQDDYNALLAAVELYKTSKKDTYRAAADARAASLMARLVSWQSYRDYWRADDKDRPYFHPSDAGMPVVSLLQYATIAVDPAPVLAVVRRSLEFELAVTGEVVNPFGYGRQLVQTAAGQRFSGFFFPHDAAGSWWQGENARLASMATAARMAASRFSGEFAARLRSYATDQLNWIVGLNPFDVCMLEGQGRTAPVYLEYPDGSATGSWRWIRAAGGIVNGITGRLADGRGIEWDPGVASSGPNTDWRWLEQWLPHSTWFLYAVAIG